MEVVVLGCGPRRRKNCAVCQEAHSNPDSKNRRLNPSLLVRNLKNDKNVLIDCGKTFHALLGMDDLREVQATVETVDPVTKELYKIPPEAMKVHCSEPTSHDVITKFPYLIDNEPFPPPGEAVPKPFRWTAKLQIDAFNPWEPFEACGIKFLPFPVIHGAGYTSFGFEFGYERDPEETKTFLNDASKPPIDVLLIDALYLDKYHSTHMNLQKVMEEIATFQPKRTLLTGMSHDFDYPKHSVEVPKMGEEKGLNIEMTYDGLRIAFP
ncbi:Metallo-beta-lactamase [Phytophthora cactorum]|nr:Metallo-beta-lactamase [Phytophthora cactorum]